MVLLRRIEEGGLAWIFMLLCLAWMADTGAYFSGKFLGRNKLYPVISPNKTWEGFVGGLCAATTGVFIVRIVALPQLTILDTLLIGFCVGAIGAVGDLSESLVKRAFKVKDSGNILPGHGGLLDRIDALMFIAPSLYAYATLVKGF